MLTAESIIKPGKLAKMLGLKVSTINKLCRKKQIPFVQLGNRRYFTQKMVADMLRDGRNDDGKKNEQA